jgi:hypothetical protein
MADGDVRGTGAQLTPRTGLSPGPEIADQTNREIQESVVRDGGGGTTKGVQPASILSPAADPVSVAGADPMATEAQAPPVRASRGTARMVKPDRRLSPGTDTQIVDHARIDARCSNVHDGGGGTGLSLKPVVGLSPAADTIAALVQLQRQRTFCIRTQSRTDRATEAFVARECLGYHTGLAPAERKALMAQAGRIRLAGEKPLRQAAKRGREVNETHPHAVPSNGRDRVWLEAHEPNVPPVDLADGDADDAGGDRAWAETRQLSVLTDRRDRDIVDAQLSDVPPVATPIITMSFYARQAADSLRKQVERDMERRAASLPVEAWRAGVKGLGRLGLAIIVAEAGRDLTAYPTVAKLWKRLGLAVIDGERQRRKTDPELAALHGYVPRRRAEMWTLADSMLRHQWNAGTDDAAGAPAGPYGAVYARRRAHTAETHPDWTKAHARDDARRVMFKAVIADLWGAWHGRAPS